MKKFSVDQNALNRSDSLYSQILNYRPHWDLLTSCAESSAESLAHASHIRYNIPPSSPISNVSHCTGSPKPPKPPFSSPKSPFSSPKPAVSSPKPPKSPFSSPKSAVSSPKPPFSISTKEGPSPRPKDKKKKKKRKNSKFNMDLNSPRPSDLHDYESFPVYGQSRDGERRPCFIRLNGGYTSTRSSVMSTKFIPESPFQNILDDMRNLPESSWYDNEIFSPKNKKSPMLLLKDIGRNLDYNPHTVDFELYMQRLNEVEFTPTFNKTVESIYDVICDYSNVEHPCCPPKPEKINTPEKSKDQDEVLSCFSVLSTPFSEASPAYDNYQPEIALQEIIRSKKPSNLSIGTEVQLDDFIKTPGANTLCYPSQVTLETVGNIGVDAKTQVTPGFERQRPKQLSFKTLESYFYHVHSSKFPKTPRTSQKRPGNLPVFSPIDSTMSPYSGHVYSPINTTTPTLFPPVFPLPSPRRYPVEISYRPISVEQNLLLTNILKHDKNTTKYRNIPGHILQNKLSSPTKKSKSPFKKPPKSPFKSTPTTTPFKIFSRNASPTKPPKPQYNTTFDSYKLRQNVMWIRNSDPNTASQHKPFQPHNYPANFGIPNNSNNFHNVSVLDDSVFYEAFGGSACRASGEGDEILKVISNCDNNDILLPTLLKDDVWQIERRLLFYFKQLKNVKYCYDIVEKIAIQDAHGITLLVQLLNTTESFEIQELVTGVFWNLSSSDSLKIPILKQALEPIVKNIVITQSGWKEGHTQSTYEQHKYNTSNGSISWTTVFRNATGCLKNLSSAGLDGRSMMRLCPGLVDSLLWTVRSAQGKNDVDNKAVENSVCILRNLSYRLEAEVSPEIKYGEHEDWRSRGLGGGQYRRRAQPDQEKKKRGSKKGKVKEVHVTPLPEHTSGVGLLWQPPVVRIYLDLLLECSNPETLEGAAGALQNLTACSWEPAQTIREMVRKEKGLSVITSLLRLPNDPVVRATAFCLRNLALDIKNKDLLGKNAMHDLVKRLPGGEGVDGITDMTISAIVCALLEVVADSAENCRTCRDCGGIARVVEMARSQDSYSRQCVLTSNRILAIFWEHKDLRKLLKAEGWNISYYARLQSLDRSDGLEYDEPRNQFKTSYTEVPNSSVDRVFKNPEHFVTSPDPTFDSHTMGNGRNHGTPDMLSPSNMMSPGNMTSPLTTVTSPLSQNTSSPQHHPAQYSPNQTTRASTLGRSYDVSNVPSKSYQEISDIPHRGHATLPPRTYNNHVTNHVTNSNNHVNNNYTVADSWV